MVKKILATALALSLFLTVLVPTALMQAPASETGSSAATQPDSVGSATMAGRCQLAKSMGYPACATNPSECASEENSDGYYREPFNCIFISEPIGGETGWDLYKKVPQPNRQVKYVLWYGEAIVGDDEGPVQAILAYKEGNESQGPFGLLYNYLGLVYNFMSGLIIAFVVFIVILGGVRMIVSNGDETKYGEGKQMIIKAVVGMILWFTASVILYTINPTFFTF